MEDYVEIPTVRPAADFDPVADASGLRAAMKGLGTDEQTIIDILCHRSNQQRQEIVEAFKTEFGRDLIDDLKSELGGHFESLILGLMLPTADYCAELLYKAMKGAGTDEDLLVEILCSRSNDEIAKIAAAYEKKYEHSLESAIQSDTDGAFSRLLVMAASCVREEGTVDVDRAKEQAELLYGAGEAKLGTDEDVFVEILSHGSPQHLYHVFEHYKQISGHTITQAMEEDMSGPLLSGLLAIVKSLQNRPRYFAERLQLAMDGVGTDDSALIRIIISRCEIDLGNIKLEYERDYGKTLISAIKGDEGGETSGYYCNALVALIGEP